MRGDSILEMVIKGKMEDKRKTKTDDVGLDDDG